MAAGTYFFRGLRWPCCDHPLRRLMIDQWRLLILDLGVSSSDFRRQISFLRTGRLLDTSETKKGRGRSV